MKTLLHSVNYYADHSIYNSIFNPTRNLVINSVHSSVRNAVHREIYLRIPEEIYLLNWLHRPVLNYIDK